MIYININFWKGKKMDRAEELVEIYNEIHEYMKEVMGIENYVSFKNLIDQSKRKDPTISYYADYLKKIADLRNMIVHNNKIYAVPNDEAFALIKKIQNILISPPRVIPKFEKEVFTLNSDYYIFNAVKMMKENDYSQIPIVDQNNTIINILTSNCISRWLGSFEVKKGDEIVIKDTMIKDVLKCREEKNIFKVIDKDTKLPEVINKFDKVNKTEKRLAAFLITETGKKNEKILGIITEWDIPEIYAEIEF